MVPHLSYIEAKVFVMAFIALQYPTLHFSDLISAFLCPYFALPWVHQTSFYVWIRVFGIAASSACKTLPPHIPWQIPIGFPTTHLCEKSTCERIRCAVRSA